MKPIYWFVGIFVSSFLVGCDLDFSVFSVDFKTDPRILQGQWKGELEEKNLDLESLTYNPNKNLLAGLSLQSYQVMALDGSNGKTVELFYPRSERCQYVRFEPTGKYLSCQHPYSATVWNLESSVTVWNLETMEAREVKLSFPRGSIALLAFSGELIYMLHFETTTQERAAYLNLYSLETGVLYQKIFLVKLKPTQLLEIVHVDKRRVVYGIASQDDPPYSLYLHDIKQNKTLSLALPSPLCDGQGIAYDSIVHFSADGTRLGTTMDSGRAGVIVWRTGDGSIENLLVDPNCTSNYRLAGFSGSRLAVEETDHYRTYRSLLYWSAELGFHNPLDLKYHSLGLFYGDDKLGSWFVRKIISSDQSEVLVRHNGSATQWTREAERFTINFDLKATFLDSKTYSFSGLGTASDGKTWTISGKGFANQDHVLVQKTRCTGGGHHSTTPPVCPQPITFEADLRHPELGKLTLKGSTKFGATAQINDGLYYSNPLANGLDNKFYSLSLEKQPPL